MRRKQFGCSRATQEPLRLNPAMNWKLLNTSIAFYSEVSFASTWTEATNQEQSLPKTPDLTPQNICGLSLKAERKPINLKNSTNSAKKGCPISRGACVYTFDCVDERKFKLVHLILVFDSLKMLYSQNTAKETIKRQTLP